MILLLTITVNRDIIVTVKSKQRPREGRKDHTMKTYEPKAYELTYSDGRGNYSALVVIAESAEQAAAYYTVEQGANVITCTATAWPAPEQPRGYVPLDWVAPVAETETTETTTETETAAETINPMCAECVKRGASCPGTTCQDYTGCVRREAAHRSAAELVKECRARKWSVCKRDLLALTDGDSKPLRWACIRYKLSFYGLDPYYMGAELMAEGVRIAYDDTAISPAKNRAERRRVERIYATREGARV